jgi:hypothetical protein
VVSFKGWTGWSIRIIPWAIFLAGTGKKCEMEYFIDRELLSFENDVPKTFMDSLSPEIVGRKRVVDNRKFAMNRSLSNFGGLNNGIFGAKDDSCVIGAKRYTVKPSEFGKKSMCLQDKLNRTGIRFLLNRKQVEGETQVHKSAHYFKIKTKGGVGDLRMSQHFG